MRLLHVQTLATQEFFGRQIPKYAILSHRWEEDEVSLQDLLNRRNQSGAGYSKIKNCSAKVRANNSALEWMWIDTCCIDKASSAELSEAINSMWRWYRDAEICYVYLSDVPTGCTVESCSGRDSPFRRSQWFTRGWTLQELIAPEAVVFLDQAWARIGSRMELAPLISEITGIEGVDGSFRDRGPLLYRSVAEKMSWVSRRKTTRPEDIAYCLMGLFRVNMPPLYGEGNRAFMRLQLEIMKQDNDASIFAWLARPGESFDLSGLLATSPAAFQSSGNIGPSHRNVSTTSFSMTNNGVCLECYCFDGRNQSQNGYTSATTGNFINVPVGRRREDRSRELLLLLTHFALDPNASFRRFTPFELIDMDSEELEAEIKQRNLVKKVIYVRQPVIDD